MKNQRFVQYGSFECQLLTMTAARSSSTTSFTIANIYRPPSSSEAEFFDDLSGLFDRFGDVIDADRFVACGDFNCGGTDSSSSSTDLLTVLDSHGLHQYVQSPTRSTLNTSNLLDVVVGRCDSNCLSQVTVQPSHDVTDHDLVTWSLNMAVQET